MSFVRLGLFFCVSSTLIGVALFKDVLELNIFTTDNVSLAVIAFAICLLFALILYEPGIPILGVFVFIFFLLPTAQVRYCSPASWDPARTPLRMSRDEILSTSLKTCLTPLPLGNSYPWSLADPTVTIAINPSHGISNITNDVSSMLKRKLKQNLYQLTVNEIRMFVTVPKQSEKMMIGQRKRQITGIGSIKTLSPDLQRIHEAFELDNKMTRFFLLDIYRIE